MEFKHVSILLNECIEGLAIKPEGTYVDATMGGAGHSRHICVHLSEQGKFIGVDRDEEAFVVAKERLADTVCQKQFVRSDFKNILDYVTEPVDGILADLGVSSYQLDNKERGFTYREDTVLDMRMDRSSPLDAKTVVNTYSPQQLTYILSTYGEEKYAKSIANNIVKYRQEKEIQTTGELIDIIRSSMPAKSLREKHPAKRTFQAIRIEVNSELDSLKQGLESFFSLLKPGGRMCIITFHSLEDRIVKEYFKSLVNVCTCPPEFPVCVCQKKPLAKIITRKPILPSPEEMEENPRSKSAKLRIIEKL